MEKSRHVMLAREGADQFSLEQGLEQVDPMYEEAARTLGWSEWRIALGVTIPLAWRGIATALAWLSTSRKSSGS